MRFDPVASIDGPSLSSAQPAAVSFREKSAARAGVASIALCVKTQHVRRHRGPWLYFGQDYFDMLRWQERLGAAQRISCARHIAPVFARIRSPLIEWTAELGKPYGDALHWWITPLASRNTSQSQLFLHICYLEILLGELVQTLDGECLVVCEDWFLLRTLELNLRSRGVRVRRSPLVRVHAAAAFCTGLARAAARWVVGLAKNVKSLAAARATRSSGGAAPGPDRTLALVHTCVDEGCLKPDGEFQDRYFSVLPAWLEGRGRRVVTIAWLENMERSAAAAYRWLRGNAREFLILEDYSRLSDYPACIARILRSGGVCPGEQRFADLIVTPLVQRERLRNLSAVETLRFLLYGPALARWRDAGNRCDVYIDMFENMSPERPGLAAIRQLFPKAVTIGYQHAPVPPELIGYAMTAREWATGVFPQRIVSHGAASADLLVHEGFPAAHVVEGPALRYAYLSSRVGDDARAGDTAGPLLVLLPLHPAGAVEVVRVLLPLAADLARRGVAVELKAHPMMRPGEVLAAAGRSSLPEGWRWVEGDLRDELARARAVIGLSTGALLEAAASAIPVICMGRELGFAYNPLAHMASEYEICTTIAPDDVGSRLAFVLGERDPVLKFRLKALAADLMRRFGSIDDAHLAAFL